jgi:hypothetical protein
METILPRGMGVRAWQKWEGTFDRKCLTFDAMQTKRKPIGSIQPFKVLVLRSIGRFKNRLKGAFRCAIARHLSYLCRVLQRLKFGSEQSAGFHRHKVDSFFLFACLTEGVLRSVQARA